MGFDDTPDWGDFASLLPENRKAPRGAETGKDQSVEMNADHVAEYLQQHPQFFVDNGWLLAELALPKPDTGPAVSLAERQMRALQEKNGQLEARLRQLIQYGSENDAIAEKMHRFAVALLAAPDRGARIEAILRVFRDEFALPGVAVRLWGTAEAIPGRPECGPVSNAAMAWLLSSVTPYCGPEVDADILAWLPDGEHLKSFAAIALGRGEPFGMLVIGSPDPKRFYPEIGKMFLTRLGELVTAALEGSAR